MKSTLAVSVLMTGALLFTSIHNIIAVQAQTDENDSISFKTTLQPRAYTESMLDVPLKSNFSFGSASPLCPNNDCKQEVVNAFYSVSPDSPGIQGTLKIESKTTFTPDIIKYSMIPFAGNFHVTGVEENRKTGHTIMVFNGDLGLGGANTIYAAANPEFKYGVNGTLDNTTKVLYLYFTLKYSTIFFNPNAQSSDFFSFICLSINNVSSQHNSYNLPLL